MAQSGTSKKGKQSIIHQILSAVFSGIFAGFWINPKNAIIRVIIDLGTGGLANSVYFCSSLVFGLLALSKTYERCGTIGIVAVIVSFISGYLMTVSMAWGLVILYFVLRWNKPAHIHL